MSRKGRNSEKALGRVRSNHLDKKFVTTFASKSWYSNETGEVRVKNEMIFLLRYKQSKFTWGIEHLYKNIISIKRQTEQRKF